MIKWLSVLMKYFAAIFYIDENAKHLGGEMDSDPLCSDFLLAIMFCHKVFPTAVVVQSLSHAWLFVTPWTAVCQASCPSPPSRVCSISCPLSQWRHPTISSSVVPFSSCLQSFPASGSFPMSWLFASGGQSIGASASVSVLPMNIQGWFPLGLTGLISL